MWQPTVQLMKELICKRVCVTTSDKSEHTGWVSVVDPVSYTIALIIFDNEDDHANSAKTLRIIPGISINDVRILDDVCSMERRQIMDAIFKTSNIVEEDAETIARRKETIKRWLVKNRITVEDTNDSIRILNMLDIRYPYNVDSCVCTNEVVLARITKLLEGMPENF